MSQVKCSYTAKTNNPKKILVAYKEIDFFLIVYDQVQKGCA